METPCYRHWTLRLARSRPLAAAVGITILCALVRCIAVFGRVQFPGFDGSFAVNASWQTFLGYRPYTDIVSGFPPVFLFVGAMGMKIWGVTWAALANTTALFAGLMFVAQALVFVRARFSWMMAVVASGLLQWITFVPISFWWYNQTATAAGALFITAAMAFVLNSGTFIDACVLACATALLVLSKMNVATAALGSGTLVLACLGPRGGKALAALAAGVLAAVIILLQMRVNLAGMADCYVTAGRARAAGTGLTSYHLPTTPDDWMEDEILLIGGLALLWRMLGRHRSKQFEIILLATLIFMLAATVYSFPTIYRLHRFTRRLIVEALLVFALLAPGRLIRIGAAIAGFGCVLAACAKPFSLTWERKEMLVAATIIFVAITSLG